MKDDSLKRLDEWRHGRISEEEFARMQEQLHEDPALRAELRALADVEEGLSGLAAFSMFRQEPVRKASSNWIPWALAACLAVVAAVGWMPEQPGHSTAGESETVTALLVDEAGAEFARPRQPGEVRFGPGSYELKEGAVHLRYSNGADMVVQGPASFRIEDEFRTRLDSGHVRAIVPPTAHGFTIETDEVDFEDVGTEFALSVDGESLESALHVFDGQVNLRRAEGKDLMQSVFQGQWARYARGLVDDPAALDLDAFPTPGNIGYLRWKNQRRETLDDPDVIAWFPFTRQGNDSFLVNARRDHDVPDGRIARARWVSGRWPGKEALLFDRQTDFVQFEIPGEFDELSVAVWLRVDRFDQEVNAILNSNGAEPGDLHLQATRMGIIRGGLIGAEGPMKLEDNLLQPGEWAHVAAVTSLSEGLHRIYLNGQLVAERVTEVEDGILIRPGQCRLGNWLPSAGYQNHPPRSFCGRMDELTIWNRALSPEEIRDRVERGRPSLLWAPNGGNSNISDDS